MNMLKDPNKQMVLYSSHGLNDLGSKDACDNSSINATYVVLNLNFSTTPIAIRMGFCLPSTCS